MTLRRKSQITLGIILLVMLLLLDLTFTNLMRRAAEQTDRERISRDLSRAVVSINGAANTLSAIAGNWAHSDAAWDYMHGTNPNYVDTTLNRDVLTKIGISSMIFIDKENSVKLFKDYSSEQEPSSPESEFVAIFNNPRNENLLNDAGEDGTSGIVLKGDQPILFSVKPILTSDMGGPSAGNLIVTQALSPSLINEISRNLHFSFTIQPTTDEEKANADDLPLIAFSPTDRTSNSISGRMIVKDHSGIPSFWVIGIEAKEDIAAAERYMQYLFLAFAVGSLIVCFIYGFFVKRAFSDRMKRLQAEMEAIRDDDPALKKLVTVDKGYNDEISSLQRTMNDAVAYHDYSREKKNRMDSISLMVYGRFAQAGNRLCYKTMEDIAVSFSPGNENFRAAIPRAAQKTSDFCRKLGLCDEECFYAYMGALFSRIGLLGIPFAIRNKATELTAHELHEYQKYPIISKDFLDSVELLRPATQVPFSWNENWDGTGFPHEASGSAIPLVARAFAVVDAWNELTRPWPGRRLPADSDVEDKLRALAGTRLDPLLVEKFIQMLHEEREKH